MKIEKSNNPVAAAALVLVLVLIVGRIGWMLFDHNRVVSAASTASSAAVSSPHSASISTIVPASADSRSQAAMKPLASSMGASRATARNPFVPALSDRRSMDPNALNTASRDSEGNSAREVRVAPVLPLPAWAGKTAAAADTGQASAFSVSDLKPMPVGSAIMAQNPAKILPNQNPLQTLKLTAIVDGTAPMAVLQTARPTPVILHVGDNLDGMRVIAIHENDIVFAHGRSRWKLLLQSAADSGAKGSVAVSSAMAPEEKIDE